MVERRRSEIPYHILHPLEVIVNRSLFPLLMGAGAGRLGRLLRADRSHSGTSSTVVTADLRRRMIRMTIRLRTTTAMPPRNSGEVKTSSRPHSSYHVLGGGGGGAPLVGPVAGGPGAFAATGVGGAAACLAGAGEGGCAPGGVASTPGALVGWGAGGAAGGAAAFCGGPGGAAVGGMPGAF